MHHASLINYTSINWEFLCLGQWSDSTIKWDHIETRVWRGVRHFSQKYSRGVQWTRFLCHFLTQLAIQRLGQVITQANDREAETKTLHTNSSWQKLALAAQTYFKIIWSCSFNWIKIWFCSLHKEECTSCQLSVWKLTAACRELE